MDISTFEGKRVHFIGVGGISMQGLAKMLVARGYQVSGSDMSDSPYFQELEALGAVCYAPHASGQQMGADLIVKNSAIPETNIELSEARRDGILVMERTELLSQLMAKARIAFGVSGMHGKTTCSSMLVTILELCGIDPTAHLGGQLDIIGGATKVGGDVFITEACEYKDNYHRLSLNGAVILNIDEDHLDYFEDLDQIIKSYNTYIMKLPKDGVAVINSDDENVLAAIEGHECSIITFGIDSDAMYRAENITMGEDACYEMDVVCDGVSHRARLGAPGYHHVYNGLAAIASAVYCGCDIEDACRYITDYTGAKRRFEYTCQMDNGTAVYHDYAHHPREAAATVDTARGCTKGKLICVFQPHTYSRTKKLFKDFTKAFDSSDYVIITDIYAAREKDPGDIHSRDLVEAINKENTNIQCVYAPSFDEAAQMAASYSTSNDLIITMGAGDIEEVNRILSNE